MPGSGCLHGMLPRLSGVDGRSKYLHGCKAEHAGPPATRPCRRWLSSASSGGCPSSRPPTMCRQACGGGREVAARAKQQLCLHCMPGFLPTPGPSLQSKACLTRHLAPHRPRLPLLTPPTRPNSQSILAPPSLLIPPFLSVLTVAGGGGRGAWLHPAQRAQLCSAAHARRSGLATNGVRHALHGWAAGGGGCSAGGWRGALLCALRCSQVGGVVHVCWGGHCGTAIHSCTALRVLGHST